MAKVKKTKKEKSDSKDVVVSKILEVSRHMRVSFSAQLQKLDLYGGQERIILLLKDNDGQAPSAIAERLGVSAPTIAKSINRLVVKGVIVRRQSKTDRRRASVHLTNLGHSMVRSIEKEQKRWVKKALVDIKSTERKSIFNCLDQISENLKKID